MTRWARPVAGTFAAGVLLAGLGFCTRLPYDAPGADEAVLRLSWRVRPAGELVCRPLSEEELAVLPAHMRRAEECERAGGEYALRVVVDGRIVADTVITASGARADRPLSVFREIRLRPGIRDVAIGFEPVNGSEAGGDGTGRGGYALVSTVGVAAGDVVLITLDEPQDALVVRLDGR